MVTAYLLMNVKTGAETSIVDEFKKDKSVKDLTIVYGVYDLVMKIEVKTMNDLENFVLNIRKNKNIEQTSTLISTSGN